MCRGGQQDSAEKSSVGLKPLFQDWLKIHNRYTFSGSAIKGVLLIVCYSRGFFLPTSYKVNSRPVS
jgi:hypothetical protein